jgi:hypothetical protein
MAVGFIQLQKKFAVRCCWYTVDGKFYRRWRVLPPFYPGFFLFNSFYFLFLTFYISSHFCCVFLPFYIVNYHIKPSTTLYLICNYKIRERSTFSYFLIISIIYVSFSFLFPFATYFSHFCRFIS